MSFTSENEVAEGLNSHPHQTLPIPPDTVNTEEFTGSLLCKHLHVKGDLSAREDVYIDGQVEGTISLRMNKLEIGANGYIQANSFARIIVVSGKILGDLYASEQVIVTRTGQVVGNIFAADVSIEDGAYIKGSIDMQKQDVFKHHGIPDALDNQQKSSMFGLIFKKGREEVAADTMLLPDLRDEIQDEQEEASVLADIKLMTAPHTEQSVIGPTVVIKGQLNFEKRVNFEKPEEEGEAGSDGSEGGVIIMGHIDGVIYLKRCCLGISPQAEINGNIFVDSLVHYGKVLGNVYANKVNVKKPGFIEGEIFSPRVSTEKGAVLMGSIQMEPQNIDEVYANLHGPATVVDAVTIEQTENTAPAKPAEPESVNVQGRNSAWPIFYPRT